MAKTKKARKNVDSSLYHNSNTNMQLSNLQPSIHLHSHVPTLNSQSQSPPLGIQSQVPLMNLQPQIAPISIQSQIPTISVQSHTPPMSLPSVVLPMNMQLQPPHFSEQSQVPPINLQSLPQSNTNHTNIHVHHSEHYSSPSCNSHLQPSTQVPFPSHLLHHQSSAPSYQSEHSHDVDDDISSEDDITSSEDDEANSQRDDTQLVDTKKVVEIIDDKGNLKKIANMKSIHVSKMDPNKRVRVDVNEFGIPIGHCRSVLTRWMTRLMKEPNLCPLVAKNFKVVKDNHASAIITNVQKKFAFPPHPRIYNVLVDFLRVKFKTLRYKTTRAIFNQAKENLLNKMKDTLSAKGYYGQALEDQIRRHDFDIEQLQEELDILPTPLGFSDHQWINYRRYLKSKKFKNFSKGGKKARAKKQHLHTTGTISFAQKDHLFEKMHKRKPGYFECFELTHKRNNGKFVNDSSKDFLNRANQKIASYKENGTNSDPIDVQRIVWKEELGEDKPGHARGYGIGVTKSVVKGFGADILKLRIEDAMFDSTQFKIKNMEKKMEEMQKLMKEQQEINSRQEKKINELRCNQGIGHVTYENHLYRATLGESRHEQLATSGGLFDTYNNGISPIFGSLPNNNNIVQTQAPLVSSGYDD